MDDNAIALYGVLFKEYPDVMDVCQTSDLLGVSTKTVYQLIKNGLIASLKIGREYRIAKLHIMRYLGVVA